MDTKKVFEEYEKKRIAQEEKYQKIKNLALTVAQEMSKLELTHKDFDVFHNCLDEILKYSKITL